MTPQELLDGLKAILEAEPQFVEEGPSSEFGQKWLARGIALLGQYNRRQGLQFEAWARALNMGLSAYTTVPIWNQMRLMIRSTVETLEAELAGSSSGERVYAAGEAFTVYKDLREIIGAATQSVFIIDAYANEEIFDLYLEKVGKGAQIRFLTSDRNPRHNALKAVAKKFSASPGVIFEGRFSSDVHDRVIFIDNTDCWVLGQSVKDAAVSKPTYLVPIESVTDMKRLYEEIWNRATPI